MMIILVINLIQATNWTIISEEMHEKVDLVYRQSELLLRIDKIDTGIWTLAEPEINLGLCKAHILSLAIDQKVSQSNLVPFYIHSVGELRVQSDNLIVAVVMTALKWPLVCWLVLFHSNGRWFTNSAYQVDWPWTMAHGHLEPLE